MVSGSGGGGRSGGRSRIGGRRLVGRCRARTLGLWASGGVAEGRRWEEVLDDCVSYGMYGGPRGKHTNHASGTSEEAPWCSLALQGLTGYCSMPGMTAVAVALEESALGCGVPTRWCECELVSWYGCCSRWILRPWKGGAWKEGGPEKGVGHQ